MNLVCVFWLWLQSLAIQKVMFQLETLPSTLPHPHNLVSQCH